MSCFIFVCRCVFFFLFVFDCVWVVLLIWFMLIGFMVIVGNFGVGWLVWVVCKGGYVLISVELGLIL